MQYGFVQRKSKLTGWKFIDLLLFTHFNHKELTLNELATQLRIRYQVEITKQGFDNRFSTAAVDFIRAILKKAIKIVIDEDGLSTLKEFDKVKIKDSTAFQLPEDMSSKYPGSGGTASKAMIRIQFEYDLKTGEVTDLSLHAFNKQDNTDAKETAGQIEEGELIIRDLGYINISVLQNIIDKGAYFINRLHSRVNVYEKVEDKFIRVDFLKIEKQLMKNKINYIEKYVYIGEEKKLCARLVLELLPEKEKKERLRKANKEANKKGRKLGKIYKSRCGLNLFISNIDKSKLKSLELRKLYTTRWQIELVFKVWKSIGEIHEIKEMKVERFECYLFAKLLWLVLNWKIFWALTKYYNSQKGCLLSIFKMSKTFKNNIMEIRLAIISGKNKLLNYIMVIESMAEKHYKLEKKKNKVSLNDLINYFR